MLTLTVTEHGFVYKPKRGKRQAVRELWAAQGCVYEHLKVFRDRKKIDDAIVLMCGTHGGYEAFYGLKTISPYKPNRIAIHADQFQTGDKLRFSNLPRKFSERRYWKAMTNTCEVKKLPK